jgi:hypothetical protein
VRTILACGSRDYRDRSVIYLALAAQQWKWIEEREVEQEPILVIHGGARGADTLAGQCAAELGYEVKAFPADWDQYGKRAGILRNLQMLDEQPDLVLAFGEGRGTNHTVAEAKRRNIPVLRF